MAEEEKKKEDRVEQDRIALLSLDEIERFFESPVWRCVEADLDDWYRDVMIMLEDAPKEDMFGSDKQGRVMRELSGVNRLQGELKRLRQFRLLPQLYRQDKQMLLEEEETENGPKD